MAINTASLLSKLNPLSPIDLGGVAQAMGGMAQKSAERERLALAREQFEEAKRQNERERENERIAEEGRNARERIIGERAQAKAQAEEEATTLAARRAAQSQFSEQVAKRDFEGAEAYIPQLEMLGGGVDITRSASGFPSYRIHDDAKRDAQLEEQNQGRHWETSKRELDTGVFPGQEEKLGAPLAPADPITGHVLDTGAMQQQTLQRLSPYLESQVASYPEGPYQDSAATTRKGVESLGLSAADSATRFRTDRAGVDSAIKDTLDADEKAQPKELDEVQKSGMRKTGEGAAHLTATDQKVPEALEARRNGLKLLEMFDKDDPRIHQVLGPAVMSLAGVKGAQSNVDLAETLGATRQTYLDQGLDWFRQRFAKGGFSPDQLKAIRTWVEEGVDQATMTTFNFVDAARERIKSGKEHEEERTGWRNYLLTLPPDVREEYELFRHDQGDDEAEGDVIGRSGRAGLGDPEDVAGPTVPAGEIEEELMAQAADAGLDFEQILPLMRTESGDDPTIKNKMGSSASGLFQFTDKTAKAYGLKNAAEYARLPPAKQIELGIRRFKGLGLDENSDADDYAMANAAPGYMERPDATVIDEYKSGSEFGDDVRAKNPGWVPEDGGEITVGSIKAFYRKHRGGGGGSKKTASTATARASAKDDQAALDLLR
jgi:hypothetical protein